ncbi:regulator of Vps4 activity in the MVB pathway protein [Tanacetum coccineum]
MLLYSSNGQNAMNFEDTKSAAEAAAESAKMAIAAAEAAAYLANKHSNQSNQSHESINGSRSGNNFDSFSSSPPINFTKPSRQSSDRSHISSDNTKDQRRYSYNAAGVKFDDSDCDDEQPEIDDNKMYRRHTYNAPPRVSSVKFDESESEYDEEIDMDHDYDHDRDRATGMNNGPPNRPAPHAPSSSYMKQGQQRVHPKLPDYDTLAARFEALKHGKA